LNCVSQDAAYLRLKDRLIASTGLAFYADRDKLLTDLIGQRLSVLELRDCSSYAEFLADGERGSAEMEALISGLTIGETYFFRDEEQFSAIRDVILPDILERNRDSRRLMIWSAGCATGAEPYSLAIVLARELADRIAGWQIVIRATDLNRSFLIQAAEGRFRSGALRSVSDEVKRECFSKEGAVWRIHPQYKRWISFQQLNLIGSEFSTAFPGGAEFDLILCRNVMIYFAREDNCRLIERFHQAMGDGGWLILGACEYNAANLKVFRAVDAGGARVFQKITVPPAPLEAPPASGLETMLAPEMPAAPLVEAIEARGSEDLCPADLDGLRQLADGGNWLGAAEYGQRLLAQHSWTAEIHFYHALIFEKLGIANEPERSLRHAIYLDRKFALAHYHLGLALKQGGQAGAAARSFGNVLKVLSGLPDLAMVPSGSGVTVTGLKELARMHLESPGGA
jgi:chemotaxis protein methyltransferase CheR